MNFKVRYLDKESLEKDIDHYNNNYKPQSYSPYQSRIISPYDKSWSDYFKISKNIEADDYRVAYYEDTSKPGKISLGHEHFLVIEVNLELIFIDSYSMNYKAQITWSKDNLLGELGCKFLEKVDNLFKKSTIIDYCYSWDSAIERIKILNSYKDHKWLEIDKVIRRENRINQLLK